MSNKRVDRHRRLDEAANSAADRWVRYPDVLALMQHPPLRAAATEALEALVSAVGPLGLGGVSWLVLRALKKKTVYPDGTTWPSPGNAGPHGAGVEPGVYASRWPVRRTPAAPSRLG